MTRVAVSVGITALGALAIYHQPAGASQTQKPAPPPRPPAELLRLSLAAEKPGLAEPFKGITANGEIEPDSSRSDRPACRPNRFARPPTRSSRASPPPSRRARRSPSTTRVAQVDEPEFLHPPGRQLQGDDREPARRGFALLRAALSAKGLKQTRDIMRLNHTLGELNDNNFDEYGEWLYHVTVMGTPSATEPWGWQLDGHHAIINYFVLGDQVVMTPFFAGSEPVIGPSGKYKGTTILQDEQKRGAGVLNGACRSPAEKAILSSPRPATTT